MYEPQDMQEMLAALWKRHRPALEERVEVLARACESVRMGRLSAAEREEAQSAAHKLAGVLGTFGRSDGTDLARKMETWLGDPETLPAHSSDLSEALAALQKSID